MSGGSYDYVYSKIEDFADNLREKGCCSWAGPTLRRAFSEHLRLVARAARACEWNDSCDGDDGERAAILAVVKPSAVLASALVEAVRARDELTQAIALAEETP